MSGGKSQKKQCRDLCFRAPTKCRNDITCIIIYMEKLLDSHWLRAVQFKCNNANPNPNPNCFHPDEAEAGAEG